MFKPASIQMLSGNVFELIFKQWMLISATNKQGVVNTMTASWGGLGVIWNQECATIYVRPQRYTLQFLQESETFSLCFFDESYRSQLSYLGKVSGKEEDKITKAGFKLLSWQDIPYFQQANKVILCHKKVICPLQKQHFTDRNIVSKHYPKEDFHYLIIGQIVQLLKKQP